MPAVILSLVVMDIPDKVSLRKLGQAGAHRRGNQLECLDQQSSTFLQLGAAVVLHTGPHMGSSSQGDWPMVLHLLLLQPSTMGSG